MDISIDGRTPQFYYAKRLGTNLAICFQSSLQPQVWWSQKSQQKSQDPIIVKVTWRDAPFVGMLFGWCRDIPFFGWRKFITLNKSHPTNLMNEVKRMGSHTAYLKSGRENTQRPGPCFCFFHSVEQGCWSVNTQSLENNSLYQKDDVSCLDVGVPCRKQLDMLASTSHNEEDSAFKRTKPQNIKVIISYYIIST